MDGHCHLDFITQAAAFARRSYSLGIDEVQRRVHSLSIVVVIDEGTDDSLGVALERGGLPLSVAGSSGSWRARPPFRARRGRQANAWGFTSF